MTAEEYIKDFTRGYSNELENGEYEYWLTPWQAEAACNLAREEVREQFEKERLKHCDELTAEQAQMESDFVVQHLKKCNRTPTFIDAIEYGRNIASEQAMKYLQEHHSPSEVSDFQAAMNIAVAKAIDSTINKSIEWLKYNIHYDDFSGNMEWYVPFADDECMIQHFKTYMEE